MKTTIKRTCGKIASRTFPKKREAFARGESTPRGLLDRLIVDNLIHSAAVNGDSEMLRSQLSQYWQGSQADAFYEDFTDRFDNWFLGVHYQVVEAMQKCIARNGTKYNQLFEIGCGDGRVLDHLSGALEGVEKFTGIDLNEAIIERNQSFYHEQLKFISGDAGEILSDQVTEGSVVMTYGGVFEYFLESELKTMFTNLKQQSPSMIALVEPIYGDFDPTYETESRSCGQEHSFCHNYRYLLEKAGFDVKFEQIVTTGEFKWMMIVAEG